jgi:hypothetical protein
MSKPNCIDGAYYDDPFPHDYLEKKMLSNEDYDIQDVYCDGYVRIACAKEGVNFDSTGDKDMLHVRDDLINNSKTISFLASARPHELGVFKDRAYASFAEAVHLENKYCTRKNIKIIFDYLYQFKKFEDVYGKNTRINTDNDVAVEETIPNPKYKHEIEEFDRYYFLLNDRGRKKFEKLNEVFGVVLREGLKRLKEGKLKEYIKSEIHRIQNISFQVIEPEKLNKIFKEIFNDMKHRILNPYEEARRSKKYFRDREELEDLLACSLFLHINPLNWHLAIMRCKSTNPIENDYRLFEAYPAGCQFSYFDIKQRIFLNSVYEIILFAIANSIIATTNPTPNSLQTNIIEDYECLKKKLIKEGKIANTNVSKKFYHIIMANNLKLQNFITDFESNFYSLRETNVYNGIIKLPKNHDEPTMHINNDYYFSFFNEIDKVLPKIINYGPYGPHLLGRENVYSYYTKMIEFLLILLAYETPEGNDAKFYRTSFMDNPDPKKKYIGGDVTREVTVDTPYDDLHYKDANYDKDQYRAYINQELIEHFFP